MVIKTGVTLGSQGDILNFISQYHPPPIPYTSPAKALETGEEKFNCLEFAEDLVTQAISNGISAQVIGIRFQGKLTGHACAGFPTADGGMLFFDSTPSAGKLSHAAHQAFVEVGEPYRRSDGGELGGGVGRLPIRELTPVTPLVQTGPQQATPASPIPLTPYTALALQSQEQVQARGILYAEENGLEVAAAQIKRWQETIAKQTAARIKREEAQKKLVDATTARVLARALQDNEDMAAQGDAYAEMRMGERYLAGDGVTKDLFKARAYLGMAAAHGNHTADQELTNLNDNWSSLTNAP